MVKPGKAISGPKYPADLLSAALPGVSRGCLTGGKVKAAVLPTDTDPSKVPLFHLNSVARLLKQEIFEWSLGQGDFWGSLAAQTKILPGGHLAFGTGAWRGGGGAGETIANRAPFAVWCFPELPGFYSAETNPSRGCHGARVIH